jgi:DNA mismatch repair protein MutL
MHERQNYEKLKKQIDGNNVLKQDLLLPYSFTLSALDHEHFRKKIPNLQKIGFEIREKGSSFEIVSVPFVISAINLKNFVDEILSSDEFNVKTASDIVNDKLCQSACKHSIRAGDSVSKDEIAYLIEQMQDKTALCPHGRPIVVKMTKKDFEKMFKRTL